MYFVYCLCVFRRLKKLLETLQAVQQLESNMSNLRQWLAYVEHELGSPIVYHIPELQEIQVKLQTQQVCHRSRETYA